MKWLALAAMVVEKIPIERLLIKPPSKKEQLKGLQGILEEAQAKPAETASANPAEEITEGAVERPRLGDLGNRHTRVHLEPPGETNGPTTEETVAYQNREIAKNLITLEKHYAQKLTIAGKKCDCGAGRHLLAIEALAEEAVSMVDNPDIYYRIIDWTKGCSPKSTDQAAKSGRYDDEYPLFSRQARDFRKELVGSLEPAALFDKKPEQQSESSQSEEATGSPGPDFTEEEFEKQRRDLLARGIVT